MTALADLSRTVASVRESDNKGDEARRLIPLLDDLDDRIAIATRVRLWTQLRRAVTGDLGALVDDTTTVSEAREACIAAIAPPKRGRGRPPKHDEPLVDLRVRLPKSTHDRLVAAALAAGRSLNDEIISRCS